MGVRRANFGDVIPLVGLAFKFQKEGSELYSGFSHDKAGATFESLIVHEKGYVAVYEKDDEVVGFVAGAIGDLTFNDTTYALEMGLYIDKAHRGGPGAVRLIKAYEAWANEKGVDLIHIADMSAVQDNGEMYEKLGYEKVETSYVKRANKKTGD